MSRNMPDDNVPEFAAFDPAAAVPLDGTLRAPVRWECGWDGCLHEGRWWRSAHGVVLCLNCQPPTFPSLVVEQGDASDAPLVRVDYSTTVFDPGSPVLDNSDRPLWILRGNRVPEKVESKEKRRKVEIPADATHWCHEGGRDWIPFHRARPPEADPRRRKPARDDPKDGLDF
jgi:hypothetical protein